MTKLHDNETEYDNIFPIDWEKNEYEDFFRFVLSGYLVQSSDSVGFVVNEEWEGEPEWENEDNTVEELICGENNGGGCGSKGVKLDSGAIQFGCECGEEEEFCECDNCEPHFVGIERRCKSCEKLTYIQFDEV